jgi:hypothetical protein
MKRAKIERFARLTELRAFYEGELARAIGNIRAMDRQMQIIEAGLSIKNVDYQIEAERVCP